MEVPIFSIEVFIMLLTAAHWAWLMKKIAYHMWSLLLYLEKAGMYDYTDPCCHCIFLEHVACTCTWCYFSVPLNIRGNDTW